MRISDWSSDVCSSDLLQAPVVHVQLAFQPALRRPLVDRLHVAERAVRADAQGLPGLKRRRLFRAVHLMAGDAHMSLQQGHQGARVCDANLESGTDGGDGTAAGVDNKWARGKIGRAEV